jgi:hypothetical protein
MEPMKEIFEHGAFGDGTRASAVVKTNPLD